MGQQRSHTHSHTHSHTSTGRLRKPRRPTGVRPSKGDGCPPTHQTHKPTSATRAFAPPRQRQEYSNLPTTGVQQPLNDRSTATSSKKPAVCRSSKGAKHNVPGNSPPSSKGDGWGVGRGRQVFRPVTFPC